jgi:uncharacterized protein
MTATEKNTGTLVHLSALSQFIIPFGNFILPIVIWSSQKKDSEFIDYNGKQAINFQLSLFLYNIIGFIAAGIFGVYYLFNVIKIKNFDNIDVEFDNFANTEYLSLILIACVAIGIFAFSKITEFILIIIASVKASNGEKYNYPLTINFLK